MATQAEINALIADSVSARWNAHQPLGTGVVVTFSFMYAVPAYETSTHPGFRPLNAFQQTSVREALAAWSAVSGVAFLEIATEGQMRFGFSDFVGTSEEDASAYAYFPRLDTSEWTESARGGDVWFNSSDLSSLGPGDGYRIALHEIGHALGLKHPFAGSPTLPTSLDNSSMTVMSYTGPPVSKLGVFDIAAIQYLYGTTDPNWYFTGSTVVLFGAEHGEATQGTNLPDIMVGRGGNDSLLGFGGNDWIQGDLGNDTLYGLAGNDTLIAGGFVANAGLDRSYGGGGDDLIVQANGVGALYGEDGNDTLWGAMGADTIYGGRGSDDMIGLGGNDVFVFDHADLVAGNRDAIHGFGDFGNDNDVISFTGGVLLSSISITSEAMGARLTVHYPGGLSYELFVWGMQAGTIADDLVFA